LRKSDKKLIKARFDGGFAFPFFANRQADDTLHRPVSMAWKTILLVDFDENSQFLHNHRFSRKRMFVFTQNCNRCLYSPETVDS
jgi:hypothetical protein